MGCSPWKGSDAGWDEVWNGLVLNRSDLRKGTWPGDGQTAEEKAAEGFARWLELRGRSSKTRAARGAAELKRMWPHYLALSAEWLGTCTTPEEVSSAIRARNRTARQRAIIVWLAQVVIPDLRMRGAEVKAIAAMLGAGETFVKKCLREA